MPSRSRRIAPGVCSLAVLGFTGFACNMTAVEAECSEEPGTLCPWAGTGEPGFNGDGLTLDESRLYWPIDVTFTQSGTAYLLDWNNHRVRFVDDDGMLQTAIGTDFVGDGPIDEDPDDGIPPRDLVAPGAPGTEVLLNHPTQVLELPDETMLLVSWHNHKLRTYDPETGLVFVACGRGAGFDGDGPIASALLNQPAAARLDDDGNLFVLDQRNQRIRRITRLDGDGTIETMVGTGEPGFDGDGGPPLEAKVSFPPGTNPPPAGALAFDRDGRLYFSDILNNRVRRVDFDENVIETVLGSGDEDDLHNPRDVELGPDGRIYVADEFNHRVLALDPDTLDVDVIAGTGKKGDEGDFGPATEARLNRPTGLAFDADGNLYIADTYNHRVRRVVGER